MENQITINGIKINYKTTGEGQDVLLLHGWGCSLEIWKTLQGQLEKKFRVTSIDFPGFGKSDEPKEVWGVEEYTRYTEQLIEKLGLTIPTEIPTEITTENPTEVPTKIITEISTESSTETSTETESTTGTYSGNPETASSDSQSTAKSLTENNNTAIKYQTTLLGKNGQPKNTLKNISVDKNAILRSSVRCNTFVFNMI